MYSTAKLSRRSFLILSTAALAACKGGREVLRFSGTTMGTSYTVAAIPASSVDRDAVQGAIRGALAGVTAQMSNWDDTSEISRINAAPQATPIALSADLAEVMRSASTVHAASDGRFDVTVGPLVDLWGFGAAGTKPQIPAETDIAATLARTGQDRVLSLSDAGLTKLAPGAEIYLPAIGKGYGVDKVAGALRGFGIEDFMVEIGGDVYTSGRNADGTPWQIGLESPVAGDRALHSVASVSGLGMATSGDYRNFFEADGTRYSHIIDPTTGRPILHDTVSATVLTENAMLADAWSTAMLVLGRDRGLEIAEEQKLAVVFIDRAAGTGFTTRASSHYSALQA